MALPAPFSSIAWHAERLAQSTGRTVAIYSALALVGLTGAGFLVAAAFIWLASMTNALIASLVLAALFLVTAGIWLIVLNARNERKKRERRASASNSALIASSLSLANVGLRIASRAKGPLFWPAAATVIAAWYLSKGNSDDD